MIVVAGRLGDSVWVYGLKHVVSFRVTGRQCSGDNSQMKAIKPGHPIVAHYRKTRRVGQNSRCGETQIWRFCRRISAVGYARPDLVGLLSIEMILTNCLGVKEIPDRIFREGGRRAHPVS